MWLQAAGTPVRMRDGRGFSAPERVVGREPVWFEHLDSDQLERARTDREIVVREDLPPPPDHAMSRLLEDLEEALGDRRASRTTEPDNSSDEPYSPSENVAPSAPVLPAVDRPPALERGTTEASSPPGPRSGRRRPKATPLPSGGRKKRA